ncbi:hypothetical protein E1292_00560 [Nonomuraea deserti]|uniref:N-acetyltransferase domain-containing protein n=1 Tax=Nonomuraea deserti TaxID=1848322 RepID=A0A4R4W2S3_9ACTN|nr:GNAT family N-acetyltransferase [Nonomuraea deserti]TDD12792.1 hypothetical protein E1292_00560 [Nonomuraea deserti]
MTHSDLSWGFFRSTALVEYSIYVHPGCQAHGVGKALLSAFIAGSQDAGVWTIWSMAVQTGS